MKSEEYQSHGFTLIELLVVIAIIGILASLLIPVISMGRGGPCQSNLRQIKINYSMAVDDNGGSFGSMPEWPAIVLHEDSSETDLAEFFQNWGLREHGWICPAAPPRPSNDRACGEFDSFFTPGGLDRASRVQAAEDTRDFGYSYNAAFDIRLVHQMFNGANAEEKLIKAFRVESDVQRPSQTPIFGDGIDPEAMLLAQSPPPYTMSPDRSLDIGFVLPRHGSRRKGTATNQSFDPKQRLPGGINVAFADGHVEYVPLEKLWSLYWHRDYVPPAKRPGL